MAAALSPVTPRTSGVGVSLWMAELPVEKVMLENIVKTVYIG
jgi:hypothetical protein